MTTLGVIYTFQFVFITPMACHTLPRLKSPLEVPEAVLLPTLHPVPVKAVVSA